MNIEARYDTFTPAIACFYNFFVNGRKIYPLGFKISVEEKNMMLELPIDKSTDENQGDFDYLTNIMGNPMEFKGVLYDEANKSIVKSFKGQGVFNYYQFQADMKSDNIVEATFKAKIEELEIE